MASTSDPPAVTDPAPSTPTPASATSPRASTGAMLAEEIARAVGYALLLSQDRFSIPEDPLVLELRLSAHLRRLHQKYNADAIEQVAEADAADFEWPPGTFDGDAAAVAREGSLLGAIKAKREANLPHRFNAERVKELYQGNPEYNTMMDIAVNGIHIDLSPDVVLDRVPPARLPEQNSSACLKQ